MGSQYTLQIRLRGLRQDRGMDTAWRLGVFGISLKVVCAVGIMPSGCTNAILRCCDVEGKRTTIPYRCFETNDCPGLYPSRDACSVGIYIKALASLSEEAQPKPDTDSRSLYEYDDYDDYDEVDSALPPVNPSSCAKAIFRCCDLENPNSRVPYRCFETNDCPGLYWSTAACSPHTYVKAIISLGETPSVVELRTNKIEEPTETVRSSFMKTLRRAGLRKNSGS